MKKIISTVLIFLFIFIPINVYANETDIFNYLENMSRDDLIFLRDSINSILDKQEINGDLNNDLRDGSRSKPYLIGDEITVENVNFFLENVSLTLKIKAEKLLTKEEAQNFLGNMIVGNNELPIVKVNFELIGEYDDPLNTMSLGTVVLDSNMTENSNLLFSENKEFLFNVYTGVKYNAYALMKDNNGSSPKYLCIRYTDSETNNQKNIYIDLENSISSDEVVDIDHNNDFDLNVNSINVDETETETIGDNENSKNELTDLDLFVLKTIANFQHTRLKNPYSMKLYKTYAKLYSVIEGEQIYELYFEYSATNSYGGEVTGCIYSKVILPWVDCSTIDEIIEYYNSYYIMTESDQLYESISGIPNDIRNGKNGFIEIDSNTVMNLVGLFY